MSRMSEDALKRGLEAANARIASLERQLSDAKKPIPYVVSTDNSYGEFKEEEPKKSKKFKKF